MYIFTKNNKMIKYCNNLLKYSRLRTYNVNIGGVYLGKDYPIRIQTMTNTSTLDTEKTVEQCMIVADAFSDYIRITAPGIVDAENLQEIRSQFRSRGYTTPLIADIHFNPSAAEIAASTVEKVRINPGNFVDKKFRSGKEFSDEEYKLELIYLEEKFTSLINICKKNKTVLRIGSNHGSLSDRIMSKYGDTIYGMVEAAMEYLRICKKTEFYDVVISMKSSNVRVMVQAYRLLINNMIAEGIMFPIHLGVTEAGEGEDGRIKSAIGIGYLLTDGIGDTIRVSLTEPPENEIPVARAIVDYINNKENHQNISDFGTYPINPFEYKRRNTKSILDIGKNNVPVVIVDLSINSKVTSADLLNIGYNIKDNKYVKSDQCADYVFVRELESDIDLPDTLKLICDSKNFINQVNAYPLFSVSNYFTDSSIKSNELNFLSITNNILDKETLNKLSSEEKLVLVLESDNINYLTDVRSAIFKLINSEIELPIVIKHILKDSNESDFQIKTAIDTGGLFIDGLADGIWTENINIETKISKSTSFSILQASRVRTTKTEYISCPSCGRTLFNLEEATAKIKERTSHLKGLKIAVMGCIVNGPGEMADADYGYVGAGSGKVSLYKSKEVIKRNIDENLALDELINLIKDSGDWVNKDL